MIGITLGDRSSTQSQIHSQIPRMQSPKTLTYGEFDCEFDFDSHEWSCSKMKSFHVHTLAASR